MSSARSLIRDLGIRIISEREDGEALGFCPLHDNTNTPALSINMRTGLWNCFTGCGGGTIQRLVSRVKEVPVEDIVRELDTEQKNVSKKNTRPIEESDISPYGSAMGDIFLHRRGLTDETIESWELKDTGLGILIPVRNQRQELVGSAVRLKVVREQDHKYSYNAGFGRNKILFGLNKFQPSRYLILVEGLFDVINMHQLGFAMTLGVLGTAISKKQIDVIRTLGVSSVVLMLDNDGPGKEATHKVAKSLLGEFSVFVPDYDKYEVSDPGEFKNKEDITQFLKTFNNYLKVKIQCQE